MSSQTSFSDDELFGEAAAEMRADVEQHLEAAWEELPEGEDVWETEADNVLGVLNGLRSALNVGDAEEHLVQAKKWYTMGERADAFEDADDLREQIEAIQEVLDQIETASEKVGDLTSTIPGLRSTLDEARENLPADEEAEDDADEAEAEADDDEEDEDEEEEE